MSSALPKLIALAVAVTAAGTFAVKATRPKRPALNHDLHADVGRILAEETSALLRGGGEVVIVVPEADFDMPLVESQADAFRKAAKAAGLHVKAEETVKLHQMGPLDGLLTPQVFANITGRHPGVAAVVSFVGVGGFADADLARVGHNTPALCVVSLNGAIPRKMYDRRLVRLAIEPANPKTMEPVVPGRETFARAYEVTTEESVRSR